MEGSAAAGGAPSSQWAQSVAVAVAPESTPPEGQAKPGRERKVFWDVPKGWGWRMCVLGPMMPLICTVLAGIGVPFLVVQSDVWSVWVPQAGDFWDDKQYHKKVNEEGAKVWEGVERVLEESQAQAQGLYLVVPKSKGNVMTKDSMLEVIKREQALEAVTVEEAGHTFHFQDVCDGRAGPLYLGYSFPCPKLTSTHAFKEAGYDMGPLASTLWFSAILKDAIVKPIIAPLMLATDFPPGCSGTCVFQCQQACAAAWGMAATGNFFAFQQVPSCMGCMIPAERTLYAVLEDPGFAGAVGLPKPFSKNETALKDHWLYTQSAKGFLAQQTVPGPNGTVVHPYANALAMDDAELDAALATVLAAMFGITPGVTNAFNINLPAFGTRFSKGARSLEAPGLTTQDMLSWVTDEVCGWAFCYAPPLILGGTNPEHGAFRNPDQPLQSVAALEMVYLLTLDPDFLQRKVMDPMRPWGPLPNISKEDLFKVLQKFQVEMDKVWSKGWGEETSDLNDYLAFTYPMSFFTSMRKLTEQAIVPGILSYVTVVLISMLVLTSCNLTESKAIVGAAGVMYAVAAFLASMAIMILQRIPMQLTTMWTLPFLMVGLGVDDTYVIMLSLLQNGGDTFAGYLQAFKRVMIPVTMTSLVNAGMFAMTITSSLPACFETGKTAVVCVLLQFITIVTSFPVLCYLDMVRQRNKRLEIICCVKGKREDEPFKNIFYKRVVRPVITNKYTHLFSFLLMFVIVILALVGASRVVLGLALDEFFELGSLQEAFFQARDKYFPIWPTAMHFGQLEYWKSDVQLEMARVFEGVVETDYVSVLTTDNVWTMKLALWGTGHCFGLSKVGKCGSEWGCHGTWVEDTLGLKNVSSRNPGLCRLGSSIIPNPLAGETASSYVADKVYCPAMPLAGEKELAECMRKWVVHGGGALPGCPVERDEVTPQLPIKVTDVRNDNFYTINLYTNADYVNAIDQTRAFCDRSEKLHCWMTGIAYDFWEQYLTIWSFAARTLSLALLMGFFLSFVFLVVSFRIEALETVPLDRQIKAALAGSSFIVLCMILCVFSSFGICCMLGLKFSVLTIMSYLMAIGFAVEYAVHVVHRFITAPLEHNTSEKRVDYSLNLLFMPMATSFLASIVSILGMAFSNISLIYKYHFIPLLVVQLITFFVGTLLLPSVLCYLPGTAFQVQVAEEKVPKAADLQQELVVEPLPPLPEELFTGDPFLGPGKTAAV